VLKTMSENSVCIALEVPKTTNAAAMSTRSVPLRHCKHVRLVVSLKQSTGHATVLTPKLGTAAAATSEVPITKVVPIWATETQATTMATRQTAALIYTMGTGTTDALVIFEIDPALVVLASAPTKDYLGLHWTASSVGANFISVVAICEMKYAMESPLALYS
jgi:hypothetical protein